MTELLRGDDIYDPHSQQVVMQVTNPTLAMGRIQVLEANADTERRIDYKELCQQIASGALEVRHKRNCHKGVHRSGPRLLDFSDATTRKHLGRRCEAAKAAQENYLVSAERARRALNALKDYCKRYAVSAYAAYHPVREQFTSRHPELKFPSLPTVYRLLERERCGARLVIENGARGNTSERHKEPMVDLICEMAEKSFLEEGSKWTLKSVTDVVKREARERQVVGWQRPPSRKFVLKTIKTRLHAMPEVARLVAKDRPAKFSVGGNRIRVEGLLQRVEQDTVHLPFVVMTDDGPCSDVYLTHAIDCASSYITGWHVRIGAPSESDGLRCVESTLFSKKASFERFGIQGSHDLFGAPMLLVLDNGPEGRGDRFRRLDQIGTEPSYCKARHPHLKPFIERLNRSIKEALEVLPGSTRMNGKDGARDPVALGDQLMRLEELEGWVVKWYFHDWADTLLDRFVDEEVSEKRGLGLTPQERVASLLELVGQPLPPPPNRSDWMRTKFDVVIRTLNIKTGVSLDGYDFTGDNLVGLINRFGQTQVEVFYDPEDYRRVYVDVDKVLVELTNTSATEYSPAYPFAYAKEHRDELKAQHKQTARQTAFRAAVQERALEDRRQKVSAKKSPSRAGKKQVVQKTAQRDAVNRAVQNPLPPSKTKTAGSTDSMPIRWDDAGELPTRDRKTGAFV